MDQKKITLDELEQDLVETQQALGAALSRSLDDPSIGRETASCREAVQFAQDRIAAFKNREREEAAAETAKAKVAAIKKCREAAASALKLADQREQKAKRLQAAIERVVELRNELDENARQLLGHFGAALPPDLSAAEASRLRRSAREEVFGNFRPTAELITATILEAGLVQRPEIDMFEATKSIEKWALVEWIKLRTANVRHLIKSAQSAIDGPKG